MKRPLVFLKGRMRVKIALVSVLPWRIALSLAKGRQGKTGGRFSCLLLFQSDEIVTLQSPHSHFG